MQTLSKQLRPYQEQAIQDIACNLKDHKRIVFQLATGGGKTVVMANIIKRFLQKSNKKILCLVHRQELLKQIEFTVQDWFFALNGYEVMMIETFNRRTNIDTNQYGLVIIDECHIGNFKKAFARFTDDTFFLGFTATPLAESKKEPLKEFYNEIVCSPYDIPELIQQGALVQNVTFVKENDINYKEIAIKNGDYSQQDLLEQYSGTRQVQNVVESYKNLCYPTKTMIYNVNCGHSKIVCDALVKEGFNAKHLDATASPLERSQIWDWYKNTPDAILCNVGIATTGTDVPSIHNIIFNRATLSLPLWLQCCGRGARPYKGKEIFKIVDLGGNAIRLGDWSDKRDWHKIFHHPKKPGVAPVRDCGNCGALIPAGALVCSFCNTEYPRERQERYEEEIANFVQFGTAEVTINVDSLIEVQEHRGYKDFWVIYEIAKQLKRSKKSPEELITAFQNYTKTFLNKKGKRMSDWYRQRCTEILQET